MFLLNLHVSTAFQSSKVIILTSLNVVLHQPVAVLLVKLNLERERFETRFEFKGMSYMVMNLISHEICNNVVIIRVKGVARERGGKGIRGDWWEGVGGN